MIQTRQARRSRSILFVTLLLLQGACSIMAATTLSSPLAPIDTSSPRSTLEGFLGMMKDRYDSMYGEHGAVMHYMASGRLFPNEGELATVHQTAQHIQDAPRYLDLSGLPPASLEEYTWRLTIQLKEVLDHIALPPLEQVPDAEAMARLGVKRWGITGTEIRIALIEQGPRAGEYLFTADTVNRIPLFFEKVRHLPYQPGATSGWYELTFHSPAGIAMALRLVIPPRWLFAIPGWTKILLLDQPLWRWFGIFIVLGTLYGLLVLIARIRKALVKRADRQWLTVLTPLSLVGFVPVAIWLLTYVLRISGGVYTCLTLSLWTVFYLSLTWLVWVTGSVLAEVLINMEKLKSSSVDSQLIRLALRLIGMSLSISILIEGASRIGLPAYSVVAGLGIGGLAVALAGQQTLANLFGSLIIMIEKPFRIGHSIKVGLIEGVVEDVGFRSTRLRTTQNTLVSIPSSELVNGKIENLSLRKNWRIERQLHFELDTPVERLESLKLGIRAMLDNYSGVQKEKTRVILSEIGLEGLEIHLDYTIRVPDRTAEYLERDRIMLAILRLAEANGVKFERAGGAG
jgi:MscS family membrane protein